MGAMRGPAAALLAGALALLGGVPAVPAAEVRFPLTVGHDLLQAALRRHLEGPAGLELWRSPDGCGSFRLKDPTLRGADGRLTVAGPATGEAGVLLLGWCWASVSWSGYAEVSARPEIGPDWQIRLRDLDVRLLDARRRPRGIAPRLSTLVKRWSEAELARFSFDLGPPVRELSALLGDLAGPAGLAPLAAALRTLQPAGVGVEADAVRVFVSLQAPAGPAPPRVPEPALGAEEVRRWQARLDDWDGFLAFVVRDLAGDSPDPAIRDELLGLLLDTRREVVEILARGPEPGVDAVRRLFLGKWDRLRAIVRRIPVPANGDPAASFRFVVFLAAGDALAAIEAVAPGLGLDFSADGLRRLARALDPAFAGDPLEQPEQADPRLQELFRFRDPDAPPRRRAPRAPGRLWNLLGPRPAFAAAADEEWRDLAARLDRWVPVAAELEDYRATMDRLLTLAAERTFGPDLVDERFETLFGHLVKATAWQESCWRQFVRRGSTVTYLVSDTADVGLMQVNVRVWRGFFSVTRLRWNAAYNAGAGAEILHQLLLRYGLREGRTRPENAARAAYSAYQGGPARYQRYRVAAAGTRGAAIDRAFWEKYQAVAAGTADDVLCLRPRRAS